ncbi:MAG TPA: hypothetical protein DDY31_06040 [Lachnospiraceae bacterium]|nr:hypothetical protein [Lachnospiraceae bacterium]
MAEFDREIKRLSKEFQVPETYHKKVDEILETIQEDCVAPPKKKSFVKAAIVVAVLCLAITGFFLFSGSEVAEASFLDTFKQTILDFFGMGEEESQKIGIESKKGDAVSKWDLMMELQEVVMDTQNIYTVVKITAPPGVEFRKGMTFDYFGFCEGTNYNQSALVSGARDCTLLEVMEDKKNIATFVVNIATDQQVEEGKEVTVFFKDLLEGSYQDNSEVLIEGMWSLSFTASYTNLKEITVKGTDDMQYPFADKTAQIKKIKLLPLGLTIVSDVSEIDEDTRNTTDTRCVIRLKMADGSEIVADSPDLKDDCLVNGGSIGWYDENGRHYQKYVGQFRKAIDINQVMGIYIAGYYVPVKNYGGQ